jgi:hypothetical protein
LICEVFSQKSAVFPKVDEHVWSHSGNCYEEIRTFIHSFAPEFRKDESLLLILGAIALFHPDRVGLDLRGQIRAQQSLYYFLLHSYIRIRYSNNSPRDTELLFVQMTNKIDLLHLLNDRHISMYVKHTDTDRQTDGIWEF